MTPGTRVRSTANLGAVLEDGPQTKFAATVPAGTLGIVLDDSLDPAPRGWMSIRFDPPWDRFDGELLLVPATAKMVEAVAE